MRRTEEPDLRQIHWRTTLRQEKQKDQVQPLSLSPFRTLSGDDARRGRPKETLPGRPRTGNDLAGADRYSHYGRVRQNNPRYGQLAIRYVHMEADHVGENVSLYAVALGLGVVMVAAFGDKEVKDILGIREEPLYIIPVGRL